MGNVSVCGGCNTPDEYREDINANQKGGLGIKKNQDTNSPNNSSNNNKQYQGGIEHSKIQKSYKNQNARDTFLQPFQSQLQRDSKINMNDFILHKVLGKGSFGKVMLAEHKETKQLYAMKILQKKSIRTERQKRHTKTERFVLEKMKHPFIIQLNFAFQNEEKLYLVLDFMNGGELFQHLQKCGRFKENIAQFYAAEILLAIEHLHKNNIFYRDLKPENVLMGNDGHIKIADFGLSFMTQNHDQYAKSMCGTPEYLAPEILLSKKGHDKTVDWWSLGALIYEMLTGLPPFYSEDKKKMFQNVITKPVPMPPYLSQKSISLLKQLLVVDPTQRLGYGPEGSQNIKNHPFFEGIDWDLLMQKKLQSPLKFNIKGPGDLKYFDKHIIKQEARDTPVNPNMMEQNQNIAFSDFTYNGIGKMKQQKEQDDQDKLLEQPDNENKQEIEVKLDDKNFD